jgi:RES domain-containing protein
VSRSLAILEIMANFAVLPRDFVLTPIRIPDNVGILSVLDSDLPAGWNQQTPIPATSDLAEQLYPKTAVLSVPSAIVADERNYVLNPAHADFRHIVFLPSQRFQFDPRLKPNA